MFGGMFSSGGSRYCSVLTQKQLNRRCPSFKRDALREKPCRHKTIKTAFIRLPATKLFIGIALCFYHRSCESSAKKKKRLQMIKTPFKPAWINSLQLNKLFFFSNTAERWGVCFRGQHPFHRRTAGRLLPLRTGSKSSKHFCVMSYRCHSRSDAPQYRPSDSAGSRWCWLAVRRLR